MDLSSVFQTIDELDRLIEENGREISFISGEEFTIADIHIASLLSKFLGLAYGRAANSEAEVNQLRIKLAFSKNVSKWLRTISNDQNFRQAVGEMKEDFSDMPDAVSDQFMPNNGILLEGLLDAAKSTRISF